MSLKSVITSQARDLANQGLSFQITQPLKGWIYTLRTALGMSGAQLGARLGVKKARVSQMEHMEVEGRITVQQLAKAADALQCDLVLFFRPRDRVENVVARQAREKARAVALETQTHMSLEQQSLDAAAFEREVQRLTDEFIRTMPRDLWDEHGPL